MEVGAAAIAEKGFVTVAKEVFDAVGGNREQLRKLIPEVNALLLVETLATTQNEKFTKSVNELSDAQ